MKGHSELVSNQCTWRASFVVRQQLKTIYSIIFCKTTGPTIFKFHMEHDLTPGSQNCKIGSGRISKMAAVIKTSKKTKSASSPKPPGILGWSLA